MPRGQAGWGWGSEVWETGGWLQVFCIGMMCCAACVFGLILGELQVLPATAHVSVLRVGSQRAGFEYALDTTQGRI